MFQRFQFGLVDQIGLADENLIGKPYLATGFLAIVQLLSGMLGIDQRQNGIEQKAFGDFIVHEKCLRYRTRIGKACGFNDDPLKIEFALALLRCQRLQSGAQIFTNGAANTTIAHLNDLFVGV